MSTYAQAEEVGEEAVTAVEAGTPQRMLEQSEVALQASTAGLDDNLRLLLQVGGLTGLSIHLVLGLGV